MAFMEDEITEQENWYSIDGPAGNEYVPVSLVGDIEIPEEDDEGHVQIPDGLKDYCENRWAYRIVRISGYGARLSAPGYLDCTEWCVFDTEEEAKEYLKETYHDDEEEEEGEEDEDDD